MRSTNVFYYYYFLLLHDNVNEAKQLMCYKIHNILTKKMMFFYLVVYTLSLNRAFFVIQLPY